MPRALPASTWSSLDTVSHARGLLGKYLVRRFDDGREEARLIVETEAYHSAEDLACHASKGRTKRTEVMHGPAGVWYVYLCYGIHEMLNLVTGPADHPAAVLIRGVEGLIGPGRLTRHLQITRALNGSPAAKKTGLWIEDRGFVPAAEQIDTTARIGIDYSGPVWSQVPWRFLLRKSK
ncbi:MAG TPA: DNA-3-methyladenine glycosylase [Verrucomicrobiales bacterium]|nr:DNA-3-methyladenine glycosylase [Verrucomicrobiales bacterium]